MITKAIALSHSDFQSLLRQNTWPNMRAICILEKYEQPFIDFVEKQIDRSIVLCSAFTDINVDAYAKEGVYFSNLALFKEEQADEIVAFVSKAHRETEKIILVVSCTAGWSRSGAVAEFVANYCGIDKVKFEKDNPAITPNSYVVRLLQEAAARLK